MLGLAEAGQVGVDGRDGGTLVAEVDLDLAEVLALLQKMGRVRMTQRMDVGGLPDAAGLERQTEGALEGGPLHRLGGRGGPLTTVPLAGKEQRGMAMGFPLLPQEFQRALGQRDVTILVALAGADVEEHALRIDVPDLEVQALGEPQAAGVNGGQTDSLIEVWDTGQDVADLPGREDDGEFELGIGPDQFHLGGPGTLKGLFPEDLDRADGLGGGLAGDLPFGLEMEEVLAELLRGDQVGGFLEELTEFAQAVPVAQDRAFGQGQQTQVVEVTI
jgi:hypothetical protein